MGNSVGIGDKTSGIQNQKNKSSNSKREVRAISIVHQRDRQKNHNKGFSPNFIHALDATHLFMTVNALKEKNISDIITVHDSFATHANDVTLLSDTLREAFVALHSKEILNDLTHYFKENFEIDAKKIPYVKDKEGFGFEEILKSEYFFA